jgi:hypothetical protein
MDSILQARLQRPRPINESIPAEAIAEINRLAAEVPFIDAARWRKGEGLDAAQ